MGLSDWLRRRWVWGAGVVVVVLGLVAGLVVWQSSSPDDSTEADVEEDPVVDVRVVEYGASNYPNEDTYWEDSVGFVVENFGNRVAMAEVELWFVDAAGESIGTARYRSRPFYVRPGEQVGAGWTSWNGYIPGDDALVEATDDVRFEVTAVDVGDDADYSWPVVSGELTSWTPDSSVYEYESLDEFVVSLDSEYPDAQEIMSLGLVYRDSNGEIIGGWGPFNHWWKIGDGEIDRTKNKQVDDFSLSPGESTVTFEALVPPEFDENHVDVYASPFITRDAEDPRWKCVSCWLAWGVEW